MEPVYAIVLAILLLGEQRELAWPFYVGVAIILGVVLLHARVMQDLLPRYTARTNRGRL